MIKQNRTQKKIIPIGYRSVGIKIYKTKIKPVGFVVAGLGFICLVVAIFPNGLGIIFYPLGFGLLRLVGVDTVRIKKKFKNKLRLQLYKLRR